MATESSVKKEENRGESKEGGSIEWLLGFCDKTKRKTAKQKKRSERERAESERELEG